MTPKMLAAIEKVARTVRAHDEQGGASADDEDATLATWDQLLTPENVLDLVAGVRRIDGMAATIAAQGEALAAAATRRDAMERALRDANHQAARMLPARMAAERERDVARTSLAVCAKLFEDYGDQEESAATPDPARIERLRKLAAACRESIAFKAEASALPGCEAVAA
jgi:septal ring factor EnvC (AmiA/AmiB activator)